MGACARVPAAAPVRDQLERQPQWQLETDLDKTSEVEVRFLAEGPERTRVELEHRNLERHGEGWEGIRDAVDSPGGWLAGLRAFAERLKA